MAIGLIATFAVAGCGSMEKDASASIKAMAAKPMSVTYAESTEPCEHDFEAIKVVAATCTEQGYTLYSCDKCGENYTDDFVDALGHTFVDIYVPETCTHKG